MKKEGAVKKDYTIPALFITAVVLVFVFSIVSIVFGGKKSPSVKDGATTNEVQEYAYKLLEKDDGTNALGYTEAVAYYSSQIDAAEDKEQKFNLMIDLATFYGKTGDPQSGVQVLGSVDTAIPPNAKYFLYTTYMYLYGRMGNDTMVDSYRQKIVDEKIDEYFAGLRNGTITPQDYKSGSDTNQNHSDGGQEDKPSPENLFNTEGL